jgi:DNA-directed RNA polymerase subunit RPC12/RpoP
MGGFASYRCHKCGYEEERLPFGHGARPEPEYVLYRCNHCKSIGSNFTQPGRGLLCGGCYEDNMALLESVTGIVNCPRCDFPATLRVLDERWQ